MSDVPKLRFEEFSHKWETKYLGDFMTFKNGINADKSQYGSGKKYISVLDIIAPNPIVYDSIIGSVSVSEEMLDKNEVVNGDILFQRSSEIREEAGQSNVYLDDKQSATFGGFVIRGRAITKYEPIFLNYLLKTHSARKEITNRSGGSTRFNIGQESLKEVPIQITTDDIEQRKIASFLTAVDEKISKLQRKLELLQSYKRGVMQKLFSQELRFKKDDGSSFPDWEEKRLDHVATFTMGFAFKSTDFVENGVPLIRMGNLYQNQLDLNRSPVSLPSNYINEYERFVVSHGDILLSMTGTIGKRDYGYAVQVPKSIKHALLNQRVTRIKVRKGNSQTFLLYLLLLDEIQRIVYSFPGGTKQANLSISDLKNISAHFPSYDEQQKIASFLSAIDNKIEAVKKQISLTQAFKKGLLQQMFV